MGGVKAVRGPRAWTPQVTSLTKAVVREAMVGEGTMWGARLEGF